MLYFRDAQKLLNALIGLDAYRREMEERIQRQQAINCYCAICGSFTDMSIRQSSTEWIDLRSEAVCETCGQSSRGRLLFDVVMREAPADRRNADSLLFERLTPMYDLLVAEFPKLIGVEFGGSELEPGSAFLHGGSLVRHEDMQQLSFESDVLDLVIHSDVLEHVPDPRQGMAEVYRVLRPGGKCIFACPIYSVMGHRKRAEIVGGGLVFVDGPCFHGDPLREQGVPVFYEFGLSLIDDLVGLGYRVYYVLDHSLIKGYFSNNNPWQTGHMWPLVVVCEKPQV